MNFYAISKNVKRGPQFQNPKTDLGGVLAIFDRLLRNSHQTILVANHEDPSIQFFEFPPKRGHSGVKSPQMGPKYQNSQFSPERADFLRAGIFLHNKKNQPLGFPIFPLKRGHSGVKSPQMGPKFQNRQFSPERADFFPLSSS